MAQAEDKLPERVNPEGYWKSLYNPRPLTPSDVRKCFEIYHYFTRKLRLENSLEIMVDIKVTLLNGHSLSCWIQDIESKEVVGEVMDTFYGEYISEHNLKKYKKACLDTWTDTLMGRTNKE